VDIAMYQAKDNGRNRVVLHDHNPDDLRSTHRRVHWARELREVLDEDRVLLYSQPWSGSRIRRWCTTKCWCASSTQRQHRPAGTVHRGSRVARHGAGNRPARGDQGPGSPEAAQMRGQKMRYFVNLSRVSLSDQHWVQRFQGMLAAAPVDHEQLVFEITETAAMAEVGVTQEFISQMKKLGCRFALDDFGRGSARSISSSASKWTT